MPAPWTRHHLAHTCGAPVKARRLLRSVAEFHARVTRRARRWRGDADTGADRARWKEGRPRRVVHVQSRHARAVQARRDATHGAADAAEGWSGRRSAAQWA